MIKNYELLCNYPLNFRSTELKNQFIFLNILLNINLANKSYNFYETYKKLSLMCLEYPTYLSDTLKVKFNLHFVKVKKGFYEVK